MECKCMFQTITNIKCGSDRHKCLCGSWTTLCKAEEHKCICWTNRMISCKSDYHKCLCEKVGYSFCKAKIHECLCEINSKICRANHTK